MIVKRAPTVETVGRTFAELVKNDGAVRELWIVDDQERVGFVVSVFTEEIDAEHERRIYTKSTALQERIPGLLFDLLVTNPRYFRTSSVEELREELLPPGSVQIPLAR